ncbi:MAG: DUF2147 domain-containing protein [Pseudomonadota bacterium]
MPRPILAAALLALTPAAVAAMGVDGVWKTAPRANGNFILVEIGPCANAPEERCGVIVDAPPPSGRDNSLIGQRLIFGMQRESETRWTGGRIRRPNGGGNYRSNLEVSGDVLSVEGCVAGGLICQSQEWTRVE